MCVGALKRRLQCGWVARAAYMTLVAVWVILHEGMDIWGLLAAAATRAAVAAAAYRAEDSCPPARWHQSNGCGSSSGVCVTFCIPNKI